MSKKLITLIVGAILLSGPSLAGADGQGKAADVAAVKQRFANAQQRTPAATKLSARDYQRLSQQKKQMDALIARMEAGQSVSTQEIDQALDLNH